MKAGSEPEAVLSLTATEYGICRLVKARGRIDFSTAPRFLETLRREATALNDGGGIVVDFSELDLITSAGLRALMLIKMALSENHGRLIVSGATGTVAEIIRIARFDTLLTLAPTTREGLQILTPAAARE